MCQFCNKIKVDYNFRWREKVDHFKNLKGNWTLFHKERKTWVYRAGWPLKYIYIIQHISVKIILKTMLVMYHLCTNYFEWAKSTNYIYLHLREREDFGASHHITSKKKLLENIRGLTKYQKDKVYLPTWENVEVTHIGETLMFEIEVVKNILFVLNFKFNLLLISKITKELSYFVYFYPDFWIFQDPFSSRMKGISKENGGLYIFKSEFGIKKKEGISGHKKLTIGVALQDVKLQHKRLGHASFQDLKHLGLIDCRKNSDIVNYCPICPLAK